jgi:putative membrane protein
MINWSNWHHEPILADALIVFAWLYGLAVGPLRGRLAPGEPWPGREALSFNAGLALFYVAVASPLERIGAVYLFSAHVALQLLVMFPAAGLVLAGIPTWMSDGLLRVPVFRAVSARLCRPLVCGAAFTAAASLWFMPVLFNWAQGSGLGGAVEHATTFSASFLFWTPLLGRSPRLGWPGYAARAVYLFCIEVALTAVFSYILMAEHPMYPVYELAPRLIPGLDAQSDQILGGVLLAAISSLVLVGALGVNFHRWAKHA